MVQQLLFPTLETYVCDFTCRFESNPILRVEANGNFFNRIQIKDRDSGVVLIDVEALLQSFTVGDHPLNWVFEIPSGHPRLEVTYSGQLFNRIGQAYPTVIRNVSDPDPVPAQTDATIQVLPNVVLNADKTVTGTIRTTKAATWKDVFNTEIIALSLQFRASPGGTTLRLHEESFVWGAPTFLDHNIITAPIPGITDSVIMEVFLIDTQGRQFASQVTQTLSSAAPTATVPEAVILNPPINITDSGFDLSWSFQADGGSQITGVRLQVKIEATGERVLNDIISTITATGIRGLTPLTAYNIRVFAINAVGESFRSNLQQATTVAPTTVIQSKSLQITFTDSPGSNFSSNVSFEDFELLATEAERNSRWSLGLLAIVDTPAQFTFEQVFATITEILAGLEGCPPGFQKDSSGACVPIPPGPTQERDLFNTAIVGAVGLGILASMMGGKKK